MRRWTEEDIVFLQENYIKYDYNYISKILDRKPSYISKKALQLGLYRGSGLNIKYDIVSTYFDKWSHNMSYILGYITADGCVTDDNRLIMQCKYDDKELLEFIKMKISPNRPISTTFQNDGLSIKRTKQARFELTDSYMVNQLKNFYIVPRKTGHEKMPIIPQEYKYDYLRGLFDGDGCIYFGKQLDKRDGKLYNQCSFTISSASEDFLYQIKNELCFGYGGMFSQKGCVNYRISDRNQIQDVAKLMYNGNFCLLRKYNKFIAGDLI